jgi:hypothetical protein
MSRALLLGISLLIPPAVVACDKGKDTATTEPSRGAATSVRPTTKSTGRTLDGGGQSEKVEIPEVRVKSDASTTVRVRWLTPNGTAVNDDAPFRVQWNRSDGLVEAPTDVKSTGGAVKDGFRVKVRPMSGAPNATLDGEIHIVVCDAENHSICLPVRRSVELGFVVAKDASEEATVSIPLPEARAN